MAEVDRDADAVDLTIMLPAYNEEPAIAELIREIRTAMKSWPGRWELIVVDDASTDGTHETASACGARVIRHAVNRGAGGACKTGIIAARGSLIAMMDADGGHDPAALPSLLQNIPPYDQVIGACIGETGTLPAIRRPAKWFFRKLGEWLSQQKIPDLNSGMKVFHRHLMLRYLWVIPEGFSNTTSMTLAFMTNGHAVIFLPVPYRKRIGKSKFHPIRDSLQYLKTVLRMGMYFRPLRVLGPLACVLGAMTLACAMYCFLTNKQEWIFLDAFLGVVSVQIFVTGLLADLIIAQRRRID